MLDNHFIPLPTISLIPDHLNDPFSTVVPDICLPAVTVLQNYIVKEQHKWGLNLDHNATDAGPLKGKMFGVLVVENSDKQIGFLAAYSGKLEGEPDDSIFVPSIFPMSSSNDHFLTRGMIGITKIGDKIKLLELKNTPSAVSKIKLLKEERKEKSIRLQQKLFDCYHFLNADKKSKSIYDIFNEYSGKKPPSAAGECAAPKLLQYAFKHQMKPLAITEFWWGKTTKSKGRKHKEYYPSCNDKCRPILGYMLSE